MEPIPSKIGRYVVEELVGVGAMGRIYKALDPDIRRTVAIKLISTKLMSGADRADYVRRFRREAEAAARCVHANIVTIYDFAVHEGEPFLAMEFVSGTSLRQMLDERPALGVGEAIGIMLQVLDALACMHGQGVIHQDIKPANIMLTPRKLVKVGDFGVSRISNTETTTISFATAGTPAYMSPEQCRGGAIDGRSDLFAAGTTLYEMVAGQRAYSGRNVTEVSHRIQNDRLPLLPAEVRAAVPRLQLVLERATEKDPADRFVNAMDMALALRQVLDSLGDEATRLQAAERAARGPPPGSTESSDSPSQASSSRAASSQFPSPTTSPPPSPHATTAFVSPSQASTGALFDVDTLKAVQERLRTYVGPIAAVLVRSANQRSRSAEDFIAELVLSVSDAAERERFRREVEPLVRSHRAPAAGTTSLGSRSVASALPEQELERARTALTEFVGPIARVLVRQVAARVSTVEALWQGLAAHVESPAERASFLQRRPPR
ncbi:MAG: serine/threonine protein kinase [Alphaproteobacteria bacterium]|nr:serine/threonine protein kinase [Alphaproteobacteria bacterium]